MGRDNGDGADVWEPDKCVRDTIFSRGRDVDTMTLVVIECRAKIVALTGMLTPRGACVGFLMDSDLHTDRGERVLVKIIRATESMIG